MARIGFPTIEAKKDIRCRKTFAVLSRKYFQYELSLVIIKLIMHIKST